MDLSRWKKQHFKVTTLELDPLNPRIPPLVETPSQREIAAHLVEHEDVYELAKLIADFGGLYPSESLIAVEEGGKKIVVEGNRRLAALKLLNSPDMAPDHMKGKFRSLIHNLPKQAIEEAEVVLAPSRAAAAPLIVARHTGDVVKRWSRAQQAKYIRTLVQGDQTIEDVAKAVQMTPSEVRNFLRTDTMLQLAHVAPVSETVRKALDDKGFSVTTLERLIQSASGQKFLGVRFDSDGNAVGEFDSEEFKKAYARILTDIAEEKISTRILNSTDDIEAYLGKLGKDKPNRRRKATWTSTELLSGKTDAAKAALKAAKKPKPVLEPRPDPYMIPKSFKCGLTEPKIREILGELRKLKMSEFPNASAVLARIFIELCVGYHLEKTGKDQQFIDKAKKDGKAPDHAPTLRQMLRAILNDPSFKLKPHTVKALNRMVNNDESLVSVDHVDEFVHSRHIAPNERELRLLWSGIAPLMEIVVVEPVTGGS